MLLFWHPSRSRYFMYTAFVVWSLIGCYVANFVKAFQVSTFFLIVILLVAGVAIEVHQIHNDLKNADKLVSYATIARWILREDKQLEKLLKDRPTGHRSETKSALEVQPDIATEQVQKACQDDSIESWKYIYGVLWGCGIMLLYKNNCLLMLCPLCLFIYVIKHLDLWGLLLGRLEKMKIWCTIRKQGLFPAPISGLFELVVLLYNTIIEILMNSVDWVSSMIVILGITLFCTSLFIYLAIQMYTEGIHLVHLGATIINNTGTIPQDWQQQINTVYSYGQERISEMIKGAHLEKLWDEVIQSESITVQTLVASSTEPLKKCPEMLNINDDVNYGKENMEVLVSCLGLLWTRFKGNVSITFTVLISIVLYGGSIVVHLVVFLTALFYLLSTSGELYKPVDLVTNFSPVMGNRYITGIESVFRVSFKMGVFYGLWTWFVHTLFDVNIVYLPSVIAAILAMVPFLGTYWACIPAALQLWIVHDRAMLALLLLLLHFLPTSIVDTIFYNEIKPESHRYLTGLSVAGGIFYMGVEGAVIVSLVVFMIVNCLMNSSLQTISETSSRRLYTDAERIAIVNYIVSNEFKDSVKGVRIWRRMEYDNVCPGRTWHSLKGHFRNYIQKNIHMYGLPEEIERKLKS